MTGMELCGFQGKQMFPTKQEAKAELARLRGIGVMKLRKVYRCPICDRYHISKNARGNPRRK